MMLSRRNLLRAGLAAGAAISMGSFPAFAASKTKGKLGLQLYSLRTECGKGTKEAREMIEAVAKIGYQGVEFYGMGFDGNSKAITGTFGMTAKEIKSLLGDLGIEFCGCHTGLPLDGQEDWFNAMVEFHHTVGNKFLICPGMGGYTESLKNCKEAADKYNALAKKFAKEDLFIGYHAHGGDAVQLEGKTAWEQFFKLTDKEVIQQMDIGNFLGGGGDPFALIEEFPGRTRTAHIKEHGGPAGAAVGEGTVDWDKAMALCSSTGGTEWYVVEQESWGDRSPLDSVKACYEFLTKFDGKNFDLKK